MAKSKKQMIQPNADEGSECNRLSESGSSVNTASSSDEFYEWVNSTIQRVSAQYSSLPWYRKLLIQIDSWLDSHMPSSDK